MMASSSPSALYLTLGHSFSLSFSPFDSFSLSKSLFLLGIKTDQRPSGLPELHCRTRAVGDEPEDAEVVAASFVHHEMQLFVVVEAHDDRDNGGARTPINDPF